MVWGRITSTKAWSLGERADTDTDTGTAFAVAEGSAAPRKARQAPRAPVGADVGISGFSF